MKTDLVDYFVRNAGFLFNFLVEGRLFSEPFTEIDSRSGIVTLLYKAKNTGIQLVLDCRDADVHCYVGRIVDGKFPTQDFDDAHKRLRQDLYGYLVETKKFRGAPYKKTAGMSIEDAVLREIEGYAALLKGPGVIILADSPDLFNG